MSDAHGGGGGLPGLATIEKIMHGAHGGGGLHISPRIPITIFVVSIGIFFFIDPVQTVHNFEFLLFFSPLWAPIVLFGPTISRFIEKNRSAFFRDQKWVLLELRMPRETTKTPFAMETFIANLHIGSGETNWYKKYINGSVRPWWSFELVSLGGRVHFYIWTRDGYRNLVETYLYAQYPEVEIIEAEDYTRLVDPASHDWEMWGCEFEKKEPDPVPLKTYMDYGLTPGIKPEENVDPLSQVVEYLGSLGPGEQFWIQFVIRMTKDEKYGRSWRDEANDLINQRRVEGSMKGEYIDPVTGAIHETRIGQLTKGQQDGINAIERNVNKQGFDVGIRTLYCAPKDKYKGINVPAMLSIFKPFNNESSNKLGPQSVWSAIFGDYPWEDPKGHHKHHLDHELLKVYRQRQFFYSPYRGTWSILSSEELATLFHVPNSGTTSPNLQRTQSSTASAPTNLPT